MSLRGRFLLLSITCVTVLVIGILWTVDRWSQQRLAANAALFGEILVQAELDANHGLDDEVVQRELRSLAVDQAALASAGLRRKLLLLGVLTALLGAVGTALLGERFVVPGEQAMLELDRLQRERQIAEEERGEGLDGSGPSPAEASDTGPDDTSPSSDA